MHLCHISSSTRLRQVEQLLTYLRTLPGEGATWSVQESKNARWTDGDTPPPYPDEIVLMGDLNFTPTSDEHRRLNDREVGLVDSWQLLDRDPNAPSEYSCTSMKDGRTLRIDHIFVSSNITDRVVEGWIDQQCIGSDHYPVWIELRE